jgi:hypothetical protein
MGVSGQRHAKPRFTPGKRTPGTHCTGGWVGPRAGMDTEARGKILSLLPGIEPRSSGSPARSQTLSYPAQIASGSTEIFPVKHGGIKCFTMATGSAACCYYRSSKLKSSHSSHALQAVNIECWDRGFESRSRNGCRKSKVSDDGIS